MEDRDVNWEPTYAQFTDAENTGAPVVPMTGNGEDDTTREEFEEVVLSHRIDT